MTQAALHADETPVTMQAEYNRVFKCLHLLDYADDKQLRQVIQESLNRGEQLQGLKQWDGLLLTYRHRCAKLVIAPPVNGENGGVRYED